MSLFGLGASISPKDGDACTIKNSAGVQLPGKYKNGVCIPTPGGPGSGPADSRTSHTPVNPLNPNGSGGPRPVGA